MAEHDFGYCEQLPMEIREIFMWLCQDVANMAQKWRLYLDLFGQEEYKEVLHNTGLVAFRAIEESLRIDLTMTICRLADPLRSLGHENLTFAKLVDCFSNDGNLKRLVDEFRSHCDPILKHRNKLIAHTDLQTKLDPENNLIQGVGRSDIDRIFASASAALNHVTGTHADTELRFEAPSHLDGKTLLFYLKKGWEAPRRSRHDEA